MQSRAANADDIAETEYSDVSMQGWAANADDIAETEYTGVSMQGRAAKADDLAETQELVSVSCGKARIGGCFCEIRSVETSPKKNRLGTWIRKDSSFGSRWRSEAPPPETM